MTKEMKLGKNLDGIVCEWEEQEQDPRWQAGLAVVRDHLARSGPWNPTNVPYAFDCLRRIEGLRSVDTDVRELSTARAIYEKRRMDLHYDDMAPWPVSSDRARHDRVARGYWRCRATAFHLFDALADLPWKDGIDCTEQTLRGMQAWIRAAFDETLPDDRVVKASERFWEAMSKIKIRGKPKQGAEKPSLRVVIACIFDLPTSDLIFRAVEMDEMRDMVFKTDPYARWLFLNPRKHPAWVRLFGGESAVTNALYFVSRVTWPRPEQQPSLEEVFGAGS